MQSKLLWGPIALATALMTASVLVGAQSNGVRIGKKGEIELAQPTHFGTTLLQPGHYEVHHAALDGKHFVVVREQIRPTRHHTMVVTGNEVARIPCRVVTLNKPARFSFAYWTKGADGKATVTEVHIADEAAAHIIALEPATGP